MAPVSIFHQARSDSGMRSLVTVVAIGVAVLEAFAVIPAVQLAVTEPRVVVLRSLLIGAKIPKVCLPASPPVFTVLHTFAPILTDTNTGFSTNVDGSAVYSALLQGRDGRLYGTTSAGGTNGINHRRAALLMTP